MSRSPQARTWRVVLTCATFFGILEASRAIVTTRVHGIPVPWPMVVIQNMTWWYVWAALALAVLRASRRYPITTSRRGVRNAAVHVATGVAVASAHVWITAPLFYALSHPVWRQQRPLPTLLVNWHLNFIVTNLVTYAMLVGLFHAMDALHGYNESRLQALRLEQHAAELQRGIAESRLEVLRRELNPHFLFNSLNAIAGLVRRRDHDAAVAMLARLGAMLRATLDRDLPVQVPLEHELELLEHYVGIERARFGDRLTVNIDVPDGLSSMLVPTFSLQPLVENAVKHGVSKRPGPGTVTVTAAACHDQLRLEVRDTGPGFADEVLARASDGVGLSNTRSRLQTLYGGRAGISLANRPAGGGAAVTIWLPLQTADGRQNCRNTLG